MAKIYGVDTDKPVTPVKVRDAIILCFTEAHGEVLGMMKEFHKFRSEGEFQRMKRIDVEFRVRSVFDKAHIDFDKPSKSDLVVIVDSLAEIAARYRAPKIIKKHKAQIMRLIAACA
jgi:hypothetical protein